MYQLRTADVLGDHLPGRGSEGPPVAPVADPLGDLARQLTAMVDLGRVDDAAAVEVLAEQAFWRGGYRRETALQLQVVLLDLDEPHRRTLRPLFGPTCRGPLYFATSAPRSGADPRPSVTGRELQRRP